MILGEGKDSSGLLILNDYPNQEEKYKEKPIAGSTYNVLEQALQACKTRLQEFYRTIYVRNYVPIPWNAPSRRQSKIFQEYFKEPDLTNFKEQIIKELISVNPNIIISMGEIPLNILYGVSPIEKYRGSILGPTEELISKGVSSHIKIVPILHPRDILQNWKSYVYTVSDINKALSLRNDLRSAKKITEDYQIWIAKTGREVRTYFNRVISAWKAGLVNYVVTDVETYMGLMTCTSFCANGKESVCIPLLDSSIPLIELSLIWKLIYEFLNSGIPLVNQNIKYDKMIYEKFGFKLPNIIGDTMIASHVIYPELPKALGFLTSIYTNIPYYKDEGHQFSPKNDNWNRLYTYCAKDSLSTHQIYSKQIGEMKELNVWDFYQRGPMRWFFMYEKLEKTGLLVDSIQRNILKHQYETYKEFYLNQVTTKYPSVNLNSPAQLGKLLYEELKIKPVMIHRTPAGKDTYSTDEETLEYLILNTKQSDEVKLILQAIIAYRKVETILEVLNAKIHPDGRVRCSYSVAPYEGSSKDISFATESGRTSTHKSLDQYFFLNEDGNIDYDNYGLAFQTIPKRGKKLLNGQMIGADLRYIYVARPGYTLIESDFSQGEARIVAVLAEDTVLLKMFEDGQDVHVWTASLVLSKPESEITEEEREYAGKRPRHAGAYGVGYKKVARIAKIPELFAQQIMIKFHAKSPKIQLKFQKDVEECIRNQGYLVTPFGRRRDFFGRRDAETFRVGYSYIPQSTLSDHTKFTMLALLDWFGWETEKFYFSWEQHDGILSEVRDDSIEEYLTQLNLFSHKPISFKHCSLSRDYDLVIPIDIKLGKNLGEMKKI